MNIEILTIIPTSGQFEEVHFGENFNYSLWVDFNISRENHWVGCFSREYENGLDKVLYNDNNKTCCVIAGGKCYLLNFENKNLMFETDEYPIVQSLVQTSEYYFFGSFYSVYILDKNGLIKEIEPDIMVDGIYLEYQKGGKIIGKVDSAENQYKKPLDISIDIEKLEFDPYIEVEKPKFNLLKRIFRK
ncbi:hypothetical protein JSO59_009250 [Riemerella anatipestifer]|uniref:hypothetical protein n=1 Tax=Riemerella anatipestifer TaxID=34085 RepID=UPI0030BE4151